MSDFSRFCGSAAWVALSIWLSLATVACGGGGGGAQSDASHPPGPGGAPDASSADQPDAPGPLADATQPGADGGATPDAVGGDGSEPDTAEPDVPKPDATDPDVTDPDVTDPDVTDPDATGPDVTDPDVTDPDVTDPDVTDPDVTDPDVTDPDVTDPDVTDPDIADPDVITPPVEPEKVLQVISSPPNLAFVNDPYRYNVQVNGSGNAQIALTAAPDGLVVVDGTALEWAPADTQVGKHSVEFTVTLDGKTAAQGFSITVGSTTAVAATEVGQQGGLVKVPDGGAAIGGAAIVLPEGALTTEAAISISEPNSPLPMGGLVASSMGPQMIMGPQGTSFGVPAQLYVPLPDGAGPDTPLVGLVLDESTGGWQTVPVIDVDFESGFMVVEAQHFSAFASMIGQEMVGFELFDTTESDACPKKLVVRSLLQFALEDFALSSVSGLPAEAEALLAGAEQPTVYDLLAHPAFQGTVRLFYVVEPLKPTSDGAVPLGKSARAVNLFVGVANGQPTIQATITTPAGVVLWSHTGSSVAEVWSEVGAAFRGQVHVSRFAVDPKQALQIRTRLYYGYVPGDGTSVPFAPDALTAMAGEGTLATPQTPVAASVSPDQDCDGVFDAADPVVLLGEPKLECTHSDGATTPVGETVVVECSFSGGPLGFVPTLACTTPNSGVAIVPAGVPSGALTVDVTPSEPGSVEVLCAVDVNGEAVSQTIPIFVKAPPVEPPPACTVSVGTPVLTTGESTTLTALFGGVDLDGGTIQWGLWSEGQLAPTGLLEGTGAAVGFTSLQAGEFPIGCRVVRADLAGPVGVGTIQVVAEAENLPPVNVTLFPITVNAVAGEEVVFKANGVDPDGDPLTFEWITDLPTKATPSGNSGSAVKVFAVQDGAASVVVRVSDGTHFVEKEAKILVVSEEGAFDGDGDGAPEGTGLGADCNDADPLIYPGAGEACDGKDNDCDGLTDEGLADTDGDGTKDCVDDDIDGDGVPNAVDNCPKTPNPDQLNSDGDAQGDACDADTCVPTCSGKMCGGDGCGGVCGTCGAGAKCEAGQCAQVCTPDCSGKQCGGNGCGGVCGGCEAGTKCQAGQCVKKAQCVTNAECNDGDACTADKCVGTIGKCVHAPVSCDDGEACTTDTCDALSGCQHEPTALCDEPEPECASHADCADDNQCTIDKCQASLGVCFYVPKLCQDGDVCTLDKCLESTGCKHSAVVCNDGNACTQDACLPGQGCVSKPVNCEDGDACTVETCSKATGCSTAVKVCKDESACTQDECDPEVGCTFDAVNCSDGNACTNDTCDPASGCASTKAICDDGNACTTDSCDSLLGCQFKPVVCEDGNACTQNTCDPAQGCVVKPLLCDDGTACTADVCDAAVGCVHTAVNCDDNTVCTVDSCDPIAGCVHAPVPCNDGNACTKDECDDVAGCQFKEVTCTAGDACTESECNPAVGCQTGTVSCNDGDACTTDSCAPGVGCVHKPVSCDDGNACTVETCLPAVGCQSKPLSCQDGNACTKDTCDPAVGCQHVDVSCDDANACTTDECSPTSGCKHGVVSCDDSNACTSDICDPTAGCQHLEVGCNDDNLCTSDQCKPAVGCVFTKLYCDDQSACTVDVCKPAQGCLHAEIECDDGNACTQESCDALYGCQVKPVLCDDGNACTADLCDPNEGCIHKPVECTDANACTKDSCDPSSGCQFKPVSCDDGNVCTQDKCWPAGGCKHSPKQCGDFNPCTADSCDPAGGCQFAPLPGCTGKPCIDAAQCGNAPPCKERACQQGMCFEFEIAGCEPPKPCQADADCGTKHPCWDGVCAEGSCQYSPNIDCAPEPGAACDVASDCPETPPCVQSKCGPAGICEYGPDPSCVPEPTPCNSDEACESDVPCKQGQCKAGACWFTVIADCKGGPGGSCAVDEECPDAPPCLLGVCVEGTCGHEEIPGCGEPQTCDTDIECPSAPPCLKGICVAGLCELKEIPGCEVSPKPCQTHEECPGAEPCLAGFCQDGFCAHKPIPGCGEPTGCTVNSECPDAPPCLKGICVAGHCDLKEIPGCEVGPKPCQAHEECPGAEPCLAGFCQDGFCAHKPIPGCGEPTACTADADCPNAPPCLKGVCVAGLCELKEIPGCEVGPKPCETHEECPGAEPCLAGFCQDGFCAHKPIPGCGDPTGCTVNSECPDAPPCLTGVCVGGTCKLDEIPGCEVGPKPCQTHEECPGAEPCLAGFCQDGFCAHKPIPGCAGGPIACETSSQCPGDGPCTKGICDQGFCKHVPVDDCGGEPLSCVLDIECPGAEPCLAGACLDGFCKHAEIPGCGGAPIPCVAATECPGAPPCLAGACPDGFCTKVQIEGCTGPPKECEFDGDCWIDKPCQTGFCAEGLCQHNVDPDCVGEPTTCDSDSSCWDDNPCTDDICVNGVCDWKWNGVCEETPACTSDEDCSASGPCEFTWCGPDGLCAGAPDPLCHPGGVTCGSEADCFDGKPCTSDVCGPDGFCHHPLIGYCEIEGATCDTSADCESGTVCVLHSCLVATTCGVAADCGSGEFCHPKVHICVEPPEHCDGAWICWNACDGDSGCQQACTQNLGADYVEPFEAAVSCVQSVCPAGSPETCWQSAAFGECKAIIDTCLTAEDACFSDGDCPSNWACEQGLCAPPTHCLDTVSCALPCFGTGEDSAGFEAACLAGCGWPDSVSPSAKAVVECVKQVCSVGGSGGTTAPGSGPGMESSCVTNALEVDCQAQVAACQGPEWCTPVCDGASCGPDGCGGWCGCPQGKWCDGATCQALVPCVQDAECAGAIPNADTCSEAFCEFDGFCSLRPLHCYTGNPCEVGYCMPGQGCVTETIVGCEPPPDADGDGAHAGFDCNDNDPSVHPGADELCDGIDNNCDGWIDPVGASQCDVGVCVNGACVAADPVECDGNPCTVDYVTASGECTAQPAAKGTPCTSEDACVEVSLCIEGECVPWQFIPCEDGDPCTGDWCDPELGSCQHEPMPACDPEQDSDGDGWPDVVDCAPDLPWAYPGSAEVCDGWDNNCDQQIDEGCDGTGGPTGPHCADLVFCALDCPAGGACEASCPKPSQVPPAVAEAAGAVMECVNTQCVNADGTPSSVPDCAWAALESVCGEVMDACFGIGNGGPGGECISQCGDGTGTYCGPDGCGGWCGCDGPNTWCDGGQCAELVPCSADTDCAALYEGHPCKQGFCAADGFCAHQGPACDDADPCTWDWCDEANGACQHEPAAGCDPDLDSDGDGFPDAVDCGPFEGWIYPGAPESCDGWDNDCNGHIDEGCGFAGPHCEDAVYCRLQCPPGDPCDAICPGPSSMAPEAWESALAVLDCVKLHCLAADGTVTDPDCMWVALELECFPLLDQCYGTGGGGPIGECTPICGDGVGGTGSAGVSEGHCGPDGCGGFCGCPGEGLWCDDGQCAPLVPCTGDATCEQNYDGQACKKGYCAGDHYCAWNWQFCDDEDPCTMDWCDEATGGCVHEPLAGCDPGADLDGDNWPDASDCAPTDPSAFPGAPEICDGVDNNCDGWVDEGCGGGPTGPWCQDAVLCRIECPSGSDCSASCPGPNSMTPEAWQAAAPVIDCVKSLCTGPNGAPSDDSACGWVALDGECAPLFDECIQVGAGGTGGVCVPMCGAPNGDPTNGDPSNGDTASGDYCGPDGCGGWCGCPGEGAWCDAGACTPLVACDDDAACESLYGNKPCKTGHCASDGYCAWTWESCDDGDVCTWDWCDEGTGFCAHDVSPECSPDSDADGDGYPDAMDCGMFESWIYPGAEEKCDGWDNNCDGFIDEGCSTGGARCEDAVFCRLECPEDEPCDAACPGPETMSDAAWQAAQATLDCVSQYCVGPDGTPSEDPDCEWEALDIACHAYLDQCFATGTGGGPIGCIPQCGGSANGDYCGPDGCGGFCGCNGNNTWCDDGQCAPLVPCTSNGVCEELYVGKGCKVGSCWADGYCGWGYQNCHDDDPCTFDWCDEAQSACVNEAIDACDPTSDLDGDGSPDAVDCEPNDPSSYPGAAEWCDGLDNNCDGWVDEGCPQFNVDCPSVVYCQLECSAGGPCDQNCPPYDSASPAAQDAAQAVFACVAMHCSGTDPNCVWSALEFLCGPQLDACYVADSGSGGTCIPSCDPSNGASCGPDGCGGWCGCNSEGAWCDDGACVDLVPCEADEGCGELYADKPCKAGFCAPDGYCAWTWQTCDDGDGCTWDWCDEQTGSCVHEAAPNCDPTQDSDGDGWVDAIDCDSTNPAVHDGAPEACDGQDNNCDGWIDEGCTSAPPPTTAGCADAVFCALDCSGTASCAVPCPGPEQLAPAEWQAAVAVMQCIEQHCDPANGATAGPDCPWNALGGPCAPLLNACLTTAGTPGGCTASCGVGSACQPDGCGGTCPCPNDSEICLDGVCTAPPPCTQDFQCEMFNGPCAQGRCIDPGVCVPIAVDCADTDPCTLDECHPEAGGCTHKPTEFCNTNLDADGDGSPAGEDCDDADPNRHVFAAEVCDGIDNNCDGQVDEVMPSCPEGLVCAQGQCVQATPSECDDNPCTKDAVYNGNCYVTGWATGVTCEDGDLCTVVDQCVGGECVAGPQNPCHDDNPCSVDSCDAVVGCVHAVVAGCDPEADADGDGIADAVDNCPNQPNFDQKDTDEDGPGDVCDPDLDGDQVPNEQDNCPHAFNPDQANTNGNEKGDACDAQ